MSTVLDSCIFYLTSLTEKGLATIKNGRANFLISGLALLGKFQSVDKTLLTLAPLESKNVCD